MTNPTEIEIREVCDTFGWEFLQAWPDGSFTIRIFNIGFAVKPGEITLDRAIRLHRVYKAAKKYKDIVDTGVDDEDDAEQEMFDALDSLASRGGETG